MRVPARSGRVVCGFEVVGGNVLFDGGRERTPPFAEFHGAVDLGVHFGVARIGEDGAAAEGAWAKFHAALKPAEDLSLHKQFGSSESWITEVGGADFVRFERGGDGIVVER